MTPEQIAQLQALKAAILADASIASLVAAGATGAIAEYLRGDSSFVVWRSQTPASDVFNAVAWAALTPTDPPDGTQQWLNRAMLCQGKQLNLQILLQGNPFIASAKQKIRDGFQDALTAVPSGAGGATQTAGWSAVRLAMQRVASKYEQIFATGVGSAAIPGALVVEGVCSDYNVVQALTQV